MVDVSIVNETSPEANWNRHADRQAGGRMGKPVYWENVPKKRENFEFFQKKLDPPPLSDILDFFEFRIIWKMLTPPLESILDLFEFENILMAEDPPD